MQRPFEGQVALVTGGGSGIGKATAILLARQGAKVAVLNRSPPDETIQAIEKDGHTALALEADVTDHHKVQRQIQRMIDQWGRLDIVFANAGINGTWAPIEELSPDEWRKTFDVNVQGTFHVLKYAVPHLKKQGGSIIINSSVNGTRMFSNTGATAYSGTKAALVAMTKMLALELADRKVRVNAVCPGWIETEIEDNTDRRNLEKVKEPVEFPEGRVPLTDGKPGSPEQVAQVVAFLASSASDHVSGSVIFVDGAQSLLEG